MSNVKAIREALGEAEGKTFFSLVNTFDLREDDDRLVIIAAAAMLMTKAEGLVERFEAIAESVASAPERIDASLTRGITNISAAVTEAVESGVAVSLDMMTTEVRSLVREVVVGEMSTGAMVRTQAIEAEAAGLRRQAELAASASSGPGTVAVASPNDRTMTRVLFGAGGFVLGLVVLFFLLKMRHAI